MTAEWTAEGTDTVNARKQRDEQLMPLTNVWTRDRSGEWVRTTAAAMEKSFPHGVSATSHFFRCYNCFQYVTYINTGDRVSHFKHNKWEESKDCEDRTFGAGGYMYGSGIADVPDPMHVQLDGNRVLLEIGFFPVSAETLNKAIQQRKKQYAFRKSR